MVLFTDGFKELKKASEPLYKVPKSIQETIEIMKVAENGIFEVARNRFSKCYRFQDINYTTTNEIEQIDIFERYCKFLNSLDVCFKITINNKNKDMEQVRDYVFLQYMDDEKKTFKVDARRARKNYPKNSMEINMDLGERILDAYPEQYSVDVHKPDFFLNVEIRSKINIFSEFIPGPGGMPVGTNGKATLLLSGGIDSPVAGYMIAKRGVIIDAVYFHAPPYTSERAKQKVVDLARLVANYSGPINLHVVNFTDIQLYIYDQCPHDELTIIMRRYMMKIAEHFAIEEESLGLITGESIGQVASQTMQSLAVTNEVCTLPVLRPLVGMDKQEIINISEQIGTYETSILPFEDCCTIFVAKHPVTKPNLKQIKKSELKLAEKIDELVKTAIDTTETIWIE